MWFPRYVQKAVRMMVIPAYFVKEQFLEDHISDSEWFPSK